MTSYITSMGTFFPGQPIDNKSMEEYIGKIGGKASRARARILKQNGIQTRYYAIDRDQKTLYSNAEMAARAVEATMDRAEVDMQAVDFLAAATSQGDLPLPGFASMVHGELRLPSCEIATLHGVCASGVMALKAAMLEVNSGEKKHAIACASEFASRLFKATRFEGQRGASNGLSFDTEFLRWMLSDGAGAALVESSPRANGLSYEIEWIDLVSYANRFEPCMYVGPEKNGSKLKSWLDYRDYAEAADQGAINLRQDIRMLKDVVWQAVEGLLGVVQKRGLDPAKIDWLLTHYSSHIFRDQAHQMAVKAGINIPQEKWFTNLYSKGNIGSAAIFALLEELLHSGKLAAGQTVLCLVPESGRFLFGYMLLKAVAKENNRSQTRAAISETPKSEPPSLDGAGDPLGPQLVRGLAAVWFEFEDRLRRVPLVANLLERRLTIEEYRALLYNLRQQVIDGSRWIARAASNITPEYFPLRSAFIAHTSEEHRDFEMLERNFAAIGGDLAEIRSGTKNIGSEALSAYVLQMASSENPFELIGTMFIVEGLGQKIARRWGEKIKEQLRLPNDAVSFFLYHSESDVKHFQRLDLVIGSGILSEKLVAGIIKCAKVTARLYVLQLEEIGNF